MENSWSIVDWNTEHFLFTYSEEEKQNNEINKANASLVFSPKFIPFYPKLLDTLTITETLLYWFIDFYLWSCSKRFYFTNNQLATILKCSERTISESMTKLQKLNYISVWRKVRAWWWQIRFVNSVNSLDHIEKISTIPREKVPTNNNKINLPIGRKNKSIHIIAIADDDVCSYISRSVWYVVSTKKWVTAVFWKYKTFNQIAMLVDVAKKWSSDFWWDDHPTIRALKWLDLYLKDHNWVKDWMGDSFDDDYHSRANREEQLYYCRGNSSPAF